MEEQQTSPDPAPTTGRTGAPAAPPDPLAAFEADANSRREIDAAIDEIALSQALPVATGVSILFLALVAGHLTLDDPVARQIMMPLAGITAIVAFQLRRMLQAGRFAAAKAHAVVGSLGLLGAANGAIQLVLTQQASHAANLVVLVVAAGLILLDRRWFGIVAIAAGFGWAAAFLLTDPVSVDAVSGAAPVVGDSREVWIRYGLGVLGAAALGYGALSLRLRTFRRIEAFALHDRVRQEKLEDALTRTERARQGESEARVELEAAVQHLRDSEDRFRRLADSTFEGIVIHRDGVVTDCNSRAPDLFGTRQKELVGSRMTDLLRNVVDEDGERPELDPSDLPGEVEGIRADGSIFPAEVGTTEAVVEGEPVLVAVVRDVTRQREAESILRDAAEAAEESNRAKSTFLANMSHELRTPLNAVIGFSNILRKNKDGSFGDRDLEYLDRIVSNGKHLLALINDVLDLSKIEAGRMDVVIETVDLQTLVEDLHRSFELQARRKGVDLVIDMPGHLKPIRGDGHRLKQILFNLVGNAMKFTDEGAVTIRVTALPGSDEPAKLEVEDSGIGIPDHRIKEIFAPFQQVDASTSRKYGGTGLGLAISRHLCEMMGFGLYATSVEGEGSTFAIDLKPETPVKPRFQPGSVTVTEDAAGG